MIGGSMKAMLVAVALLLICSVADAKDNVKKINLGDMWGKWFKGNTSFFLDHRRKRPSLVWIMVAGEHVSLRSNVSILADVDGVSNSIIYEIEGRTNRELSVGGECVVRLIKFSLMMLGGKSDYRKAVVFEGFGSLTGQIWCGGKYEQAVSKDMSGRWSRILTKEKGS